MCFEFSTAVGHYTAMVWSTTNKVGCGVTEYRDGKWFAKLYTCNYGPAGNYINGEMYKQGKACSKCPSGTSCSKQFPGLCGKILLYVCKHGNICLPFDINTYFAFCDSLQITANVSFNKQ